MTRAGEPPKSARAGDRKSPRPPLPMQLEIADLRLVKAIVEHGGMARASEILHLTPSALSHRLADLERRAGVALFARVGRRLLLTPPGELLCAEAPKLLAAVGELEASLRRSATSRAAAVRIATECYTCYHWLPRVLEQFESEHAEVEVRIVLSATRRAVRALLDGELDVAVADARPTDPRLAVHPLFTSELVAVASPQHAWASRPFVRAEDFAGERLLRFAMPREHSTLLTEILAPAGVEPAREETVELTEALLELVKAGRGVTALAGWMVAPQVERGELVAVPIREAAARRRWVAVTRRQQRPEPHVAAFVRALRAATIPGVVPTEGDAPAAPAEPAATRAEPPARARSSRKPPAARPAASGRGV